MVEIRLNVLNHEIQKRILRKTSIPSLIRDSNQYSKAIMNRTRLRNICCKDSTADNLKAYKKQRNKCFNILRQAKKDYYKDLHIKDFTDNRNFWRSVKLLFSDKVKTSSTILLMENEKIVSEDRAVVDILNEYFSTISESLNIASTMKINCLLLESQIQSLLPSKNTAITQAYF